MQTARRTTSTGKPAGYPDLRQHIATLEQKGLLYRITEPVDKDAELHPLVRWQFRGGIPERDRKAFLFENVVDGHGKRYDFPVIVGALAASPEIYATGLRATVDEVPARWAKARTSPIPPVSVDGGPVHENVLVGEDLDRFGGLTALPVPISTPGFDNGPYLTAGHFISISPATGERNVGNYRGMIKGPKKLAVFPNGPSKGLWRHWDEAYEKGEKLPCAVVVGCTPAFSYTAVQQIPHGMDEIAVAGGLAGEPIQLVKCVTIPLAVPAEAELVIEGYVNMEVLEPEGPYGESHGYVHPRTLAPFIDVTAITFRNGMIFSSMISQVTPSESSVVKKVGYEVLFLNHLKDYLGIKPVKRVY
ncbi:MAG: UbiD family decarboxylase, partial [Gemmataceae bacterium]|nr:UbiD family decarboxylase [Gemmataceae bacterium]